MNICLHCNLCGHMRINESKDYFFGNCGHMLCKDCLQRGNGNCPYCRKPMSFTNIEEKSRQGEDIRKLFLPPYVILRDGWEKLLKDYKRTSEWQQLQIKSFHSLLVKIQDQRVEMEKKAKATMDRMKALQSRKKQLQELIAKKKSENARQKHQNQRPCQVNGDGRFFASKNPKAQIREPSIYELKYGPNGSEHLKVNNHANYGNNRGTTSAMRPSQPVSRPQVNLVRTESQYCQKRPLDMENDRQYNPKRVFDGNTSTQRSEPSPSSSFVSLGQSTIIEHEHVNNQGRMRSIPSNRGNSPSVTNTPRSNVGALSPASSASGYSPNSYQARTNIVRGTPAMRVSPVANKENNNFGQSNYPRNTTHSLGQPQNPVAQRQNSLAQQQNILVQQQNNLAQRQNIQPMNYQHAGMNPRQEHHERQRPVNNHRISPVLNTNSRMSSNNEVRQTRNQPSNFGPIRTNIEMNRRPMEQQQPQPSTNNLGTRNGLPVTPKNFVAHRPNLNNHQTRDLTFKNQPNQNNGHLRQRMNVVLSPESNYGLSPNTSFIPTAWTPEPPPRYRNRN